MKKYTQASINKLIKNRPSFQSIDLSYSDLSGLNLSNLNLSCFNFTGSKLQRTLLSKANLYGAKLFGADLSFANLSNANMSQAMLCGINLYKANLEYVKFEGNVSLYGANLELANLEHANLRWADLTYANLSHANLSHASLTYADLHHTFFIETNLQGVNFTNTWNTETALFSEINLAGDKPTIGDGKVIISLQLDGLHTAFTRDVIAIGRYQYPVEELLKIDANTTFNLQDLTELDLRYKPQALEWWKKWKDTIIAIMDRSFHQE